jgi:hypothetical protein
VKSILKKIPQLSSLSAGIILGVFGCTNTAYASTSDAISAAATQIIQELHRLFYDIAESYEAVVRSNYDQNTVESKLASDHIAEKQGGDYTNTFIFNSLTAPSTKNKSAPKRNSPGYFAAMVPYSADAGSVADQTPYLTGTTLLSNTMLNDKQAPQANSFIQVLADGGNRIPQLDPELIDKVKGTPEAVSYLNTMATYNAATSVALSTFNTMLAERLPAPAFNKKDSILSFDEKGAARRMQDAWISTVPKMTTVDLLRESLYTQAEMRYEMFQLHMQLEQLNATLAALLLSQQQTMNKSLIQQKQQQLLQANSNTTGG